MTRLLIFYLSLAAFTFIGCKNKQQTKNKQSGESLLYWVSYAASKSYADTTHFSLISKTDDSDCKYYYLLSEHDSIQFYFNLKNNKLSWDKGIFIEATRSKIDKPIVHLQYESDTAIFVNNKTYTVYTFFHNSEGCDDCEAHLSFTPDYGIIYIRAPVKCIVHSTDSATEHILQQLLAIVTRKVEQ